MRYRRALRVCWTQHWLATADVEGRIGSGQNLRSKLVSAGFVSEHGAVNVLEWLVVARFCGSLQPSSAGSLQLTVEGALPLKPGRHEHPEGTSLPQREVPNDCIHCDMEPICCLSLSLTSQTSCNI